MISSLDQYRITKQGKIEAFVLSFFITILGLAVPVVTLQVYDRLLKNHSVETATVLIVGAAIAIALESFLRYGRAYLLSQYAVGFETTAEKHYMRKFINLTKKERLIHGPALISQNQTDLALLKNHYSGQTVIALFDLPFSLLYLFIIWYVGGVIVVVPLILMAIVVILAWSFRRSAAPAIIRRDADQLSLIAKLYTLFSNGRHTKFDVEKAINETTKVSKKARESRMVVATLNLFSTDAVAGLSQLVTIGIVVFGAILVIHGKMSTGGLAALTILAGRSIGPVARLIAYNIGLESLDAATTRINTIDTLEENALFDDTTKREKSSEISYTIEDTVDLDLGRFSFALALKSGDRFSLRATKDNDLKELFFDIILGERTTESTLGGVALQDYSRDHYFQEVGYVTSQSILFPGTLLENLSNFSEEYEDKALELSETLGVLALINKLPHGTKTLVNSLDYPPLGRGVIQMIALIRVLVSAPKVLILRGGDAHLDISFVQTLAAYLKDQKELIIIADNISDQLEELLQPLDLTDRCKEVSHG